MIVKNATMNDLEEALAVINWERYSIIEGLCRHGNIKFKTLDQKGTSRIHFTLTVNQTSIGTGKAKVAAPGVSIKRGRRIAAACWHVHGDFFDALFNLAPDAEIYSNMTGIWEKKGDPWKDYQVGTHFDPMMASQACECRRNARTERILKSQEGIS